MKFTANRMDFFMEHEEYGEHKVTRIQSQPTHPSAIFISNIDGHLTVEQATWYVKGYLNGHATANRKVTVQTQDLIRNYYERKDNASNHQ